MTLPIQLILATTMERCIYSERPTNVQTVPVINHDLATRAFDFVNCLPCGCEYVCACDDAKQVDGVQTNTSDSEFVQESKCDSSDSESDDEDEPELEHDAANNALYPGASITVKKVF